MMQMKKLILTGVAYVLVYMKMMMQEPTGIRYVMCSCGGECMKAV